MIGKFKSRQYFAFLVAGGLAALVNFCSRLLYSRWVDFSIAVVMAYLTGMLVAFVLVKVFVFKGSRQVLHRSVIYFVLVNLMAVAQTWAISLGLAYYALPAMGVDRYVREIAHAAGVIVPVFSSYLGHKHLSFR